MGTRALTCDLDLPSNGGAVPALVTLHVLVVEEFLVTDVVGHCVEHV